MPASLNGSSKGGTRSWFDQRMKVQLDDRRILAMEVRRSCFGYATFQGPKQLLDWGATTPYPLPGAPGRAKKRLLSILKMLPPDVVVLKRPRTKIAHHEILRSIRQEASGRSIPLAFITLDEVRRVFSIFRAKNKDDIAAVLVGIFPELLGRLPPKRGKANPERQAMTVFDAVATGFAYMQRHVVPRAPPE